MRRFHEAGLLEKGVKPVGLAASHHRVIIAIDSCEHGNFAETHTCDEIWGTRYSAAATEPTQVFTADQGISKADKIQPAAIAVAVSIQGVSEPGDQELQVRQQHPADGRVIALLLVSGRYVGVFQSSLDPVADHRAFSI